MLAAEREKKIHNGPETTRIFSLMYLMNGIFYQLSLTNNKRAYFSVKTFYLNKHAFLLEDFNVLFKSIMRRLLRGKIDELHKTYRHRVSLHKIKWSHLFNYSISSLSVLLRNILLAQTVSVIHISIYFR